MIYTCELIQDGVTVATVIAPTKKQALKEIEHYAFMYEQDGPVTIIKKWERKKS